MVILTLPPSKIDVYKVVERLGMGSYATVWKIEDVSDKTKYLAVKKLELVNPEIKEFAERESKILNQLKGHPNIVLIKETIEHSDTCFIFMECLGINLRDRLIPALHPRLIESEIKSFLSQILSAVRYCHNMGVIHRDIKPGNILMNSERKLLKLADFGASIQLTASQILTSDVGSLPYTAPEILLGSKDYSYAVDIWSVGCVFAHMVKGEMFFAEDGQGGTENADVLKRIFRIMGTPSEKDLPGSSLFIKSHEISYTSPKDLKDEFPELHPLGSELMSRMLCLNPETRITARDALHHPFVESKERV